MKKITIALTGFLLGFFLRKYIPFISKEMLGEYLAVWYFLRADNQ
jgi:hypothetical protein